MGGWQTVVLAAALLALLGSAAAGPRVQISSNVRLYTKFANYPKVCSVAISRAKKAGAHAIGFVPTLHYVDRNKDGIPDRYCYAAGAKTCVKITAKTRMEFQKAMFSCFRKAYAAGIKQIEVLPHLNDANGDSWRNVMKIDPLQRYAGSSYYEFMIAPLVRALNKAVPKRYIVFFNLQGEMNGALISHPDDWQKLGSIVKRQVSASRKYVGLNLNFNKVCAWCTGGNFKPSGGPGEQFDNAKVQALFRSVDYLGTSAYAPTWNAGDSTAFVTPQKIEASLYVLQDELSYFGVDLAGLNAAGKPIHYSEFGLGGATCETATACPAQNAADVAKYPFFGISGGYNPNADPWKVEDNKRFRREYYANAIKYAANYANNKYKVTHIILWNHGSYDVQGIFPDSTNKFGSWKDATIAGWIQAWNRRGSIPA